MCLNCHVVTIDVKIKSLTALICACERLGWEFRYKNPTYKWAGYWADDSPVPRAIFDTEAKYNAMIAAPRNFRQQHMPEILNDVQHSIHIPNLEYELGVKLVNDQWQIVGDWWGDIKAIIHNGQNPLAQAYAIEQAKLTAYDNRQTYTEHQLADGTVELHVQIQE